MIWYLLATATTSFVLGFGVCQNLYSKKITKLAEALDQDYQSKWKETFDAGWDAANASVTNVKLQYDKLVNPLKYTSNEE